MNYNVAWKGHLKKNNPRLRSWPDRKRSCCISVDPYGRPEHIYGVFIALVGLYQKLLPKSCWLPFVTWNDLKIWRHGEGSLVAIFRLRVSSLPVTRCSRAFRMSFFQKRRLSFFAFHFLLSWTGITKTAALLFLRSSRKTGVGRKYAPPLLSTTRVNNQIRRWSFVKAKYQMRNWLKQCRIPTGCTTPPMQAAAYHYLKNKNN